MFSLPSSLLFFGSFFFFSDFVVSLMAFIFQNAFFLLANTSFERDRTSRNLLLVIKFFTLFREQIESMLVKTLFLDEGVSLPTYHLNTSTLSLVSSFKIFVGLERKVRLLIIHTAIPVAVTWNFTSTLKMKHLELFTTQDIFFMKYYLKIAHILPNRTAMNIHKTKWEFMIICGFSLGCESNPLSLKLLIFFFPKLFL